MNDSTTHLSEWTLEQLAEGMLPDAELAGATAHVEACGRCSAELEAFRSLFATLGALPRLAPSPAFGDAVMARVRVGPAPSATWALVQRMVPSTRRGWTLLGAAIAAPALAVAAAVAWLLSHPLVSAAGLVQVARQGVAGATESALALAVGWGVDSGVFGAAQTALEAARSVPLGTLSLVLAVLAVAIPLSAWSLIRLVRTPMETVNYAN